MSSCTCNNWEYNLPCCCSDSTTTTTHTTTLCPGGELCDEAYLSDCVIYKGPNLDCYGIHTGMTVTEIIQILINQLPGCTTTTTTTIAPTTTTTSTTSTTTSTTTTTTTIP